MTEKPLLPHCLVLLCLCLLAACGAPVETVMTGKTMGTTYTVKYVRDGGALALAAWDRAESLFDETAKTLRRVNAVMSTYDPDSDISKLNRHESDAPFAVPPDLMDVLVLSQDISKLSADAFDITVGPIVNIYGFGPEPKMDRLPSDEEIAALRERVGYKKLQLRPTDLTVVKAHPKLYADLSAVAKGYGVDQVAAVLDKAGHGDYMVEIGGEVRVKGTNKDGRPWQIAVEKPVEGRREIHRVLGLTDIAMATSGDYRNYYMADGRRISHTIDPRTGRPVEHNLASVTVLDKTCARADALATAFMVLGAKEGMALAEREGIIALFLVRGEGGAVLETTSSAFKARFP